VGTWGYGAFENDDAGALIGGITSGLESELVSFVHRVRFAYAMHYDRARAAAVVLTKLATLGLRWSPPEDATAPRIEATFRAYFATITTLEPEHRQAIDADIAELVRTFGDADVVVAPPPPDTVRGALRAIGAEPAAWWWADRFGFDFAKAWEQADSLPRRIPQVALAAGVDAGSIMGAFAAALLRDANGVEHSRLAIRGDVVKLLAAMAGGSRSSAKLAARICDASKAEGDAWLKRFRANREAASAEVDDPLLGILHETAELIRMSNAAAECGALDPYRAGDFVEKLARDSKAGAVVATLRAALEPAVLAAVAGKARALGDEVRIPIGTVYRKPPKR
jgi:hypothetical protein